MPNNWQMVDSNFPTITGEEPVKEQIGKIIDYLSILTEQLQYQLQNLDSSNWNASALTELEENTALRLTTILKRLESTVNSLSGRIESAEGVVGRLTDAEESIAAQDAAMTELLEEFEQVKETIEGTEGTDDAEGTKGIAERLTDAEESIAAQDAAMTEHLQEFKQVREAIEGTEDTEDTEGTKGIAERLADAEETIAQLTQLLSGITVAEDETTVGGEGKTVHLIGTVYINGVLQGEAEEEGTT